MQIEIDERSKRIASIAVEYVFREDLTSSPEPQDESPEMQAELERPESPEIDPALLALAESRAQSPTSDLGSAVSTAPPRKAFPDMVAADPENAHLRHHTTKKLKHGEVADDETRNR